MHRKALSALVVVLLAANAMAFGIRPAPHNIGSEHEKITRAAIRDLDPRTLSQLAGNGEDPGAVGVADTSDRDLKSTPEVHCHGGDFLPPGEKAAGYAQSADTAQAALLACRQFIYSNIDRAVRWAGVLATAQEDDVALPCKFNGHEATAKCNVLENLGLAFHAAQDFYAHTNYVDRPSKGALSARNPPGLDQTGRAKWLDPRLDETFPEGLISGCPGDLHVLGITFGCEYGLLPPLVGKIRVMSADLAKDSGPIGSGQGGVGTTPRGRVNGNFGRAVAAAIEDTADKWAYFKEQVIRKYGQANGNRIICLVKRDDFNPKGCDEVASQDKTCQDRDALADDTDNGDVFVPALTATNEEKKAAESLHDRLKQFCVIEETDVTRSSRLNDGTSEAGRDSARSTAVGSLAIWNACPAQLSRRLPDMTQKAKDAYQALIKQAKPDPKSELQLLSRIYSNCILGVNLQKQGK
jgi:hypothetical protein